MLKKQNGITLIALIITVIVMLILVGVTINVALNGGLFEKGSEAAKKTEEDAIYEQAIMAMTLTDKGKINVNETYGKVKTALEEQGMRVSAMQNGLFTVEGKNGTYTYTITEKEIVKGKAGGSYKFYGTDEMYVVFTPNEIILKDNAGNFLDAGESLQLETKTKKEFFDGEFFNNLSDEEKKSIQDGFAQMEQQYGEVTTLFFPYIDGDLSPYPQGFMTDGSNIYVMGEGTIELEENEELKKRLVKKKSAFKVFSEDGELNLGTGTSLSDIELFALVDTSGNLFETGLISNRTMDALLKGTTTITKNDSAVKVIVEGTETTIREGGDKILVTVTRYGEGTYSGEKQYVCYIQDNTIYLEKFTQEDNFDGQVSEGEEFAKMIAVTDYSKLSELEIYLED